MKREEVCLLIAGFIGIGTVQGQTWPDYHLTNGTHYTSYGVESYDPENPVKNLYIEPVAILEAGGTELDDIYDGNQVYLNGGTVYASAIDADDFTWNSGDLYLDGGTHSTLYGLGSGTGKILNIDSGAIVQDVFLSSLPSGNQLNLNKGGTLSVGDFNTAMDGFYFDYGGTLEVAGTMTGTVPLEAGSSVILRGPAASWNLGTSSLRLDYERGPWGGASVIVTGGAQLTSNGGDIGADGWNGYNSVEVSGAGSQWNSGDLHVGWLDRGNRLLVSNGGVVTSASGIIGEASDNNVVEISGAGSQWNMSGGLMVAVDRGSNNRLTISDGGVVNSTHGVIGGHRGSNDNEVEVSGVGSQWKMSGDLTNGNASEGNSLLISNGGTVLNLNSYIGINGVYYTGSMNSVTVTGSGSKWQNNGTLTVGPDTRGGGNRVWISDGGEVVAQGGVVINGPRSNELHLDEGGRLTVGTDFDASMQGFYYNSGSTLSVAGQLSGLSSLDSGRRLEAPNVLGDLTVHGIFAPGNSPADSIVNGNLTIASDGTLEMEMAGYAMGTEHDRLTVAGLSELDGNLQLVLLDGFSPVYGDVFDLFNWDGGVGGEFASISTTALSGSLEWDTSELYTTGQLSVIPEPGVFSLMAVFGGAMWFVRRYFPCV